MDRAFWRGRRVLITGHTGFKGAWLASVLLRSEAIVTGLALEPAGQHNLFEVLELRRRMHSVIGDIRDKKHLRMVVAETQPQIVFHLAAQAIVRTSYRDPLETFDTNVMGTAKVLESLRGVEGLAAAIVVTSDKCYRNREWIWPYREDDALGGEDPYSASKAATELVAHAYAASYDDLPPVLTARAGNVIGGGDWSVDRLVPDIVAASAEGRAPVLRYPGAVRPWQHVLDPLHGYIVLAERASRGEDISGAWNFGPSDSGATVGQLTEALLQALGRPPSWETIGDAQPHEAGTLRVDSTKARQLLGWRSKLSTSDAIDWTARWYRDWMMGADMIGATDKQIDEYAGR